MKTNQRSIQCGTPRTSLLVTLTTIVLFSCSLQAFAQQWNTSGNDISNANSGNVGVGTSSPGVKLDILSPASMIARFNSSASGNTQVLIDAPAGFNSNLTLQRGGVPKWYLGNRASNDRFSFIEAQGQTEHLALLQNGNLGIGTINPNARFEVVGPGTWVAKFKRTDNSNGGILIESPTGFNPNVALGVNGVPKWYLLSNSSNSDSLQFWDSSGAFLRFTLTQAGTVGLGTGTPNGAYKLDVSGNINATALCINNDCKTTWQAGGSSQWTSNGTTINYSGGNVGIGTATPLAKLHVSGIDAWGTAAFSGSQWTSHFNLGGDNTEDTYIRGGKSTSRVIIGDVNAGHVLVAQGGGNVGIGTATPTAKLHVQGDGRFTGSLTVDGNIAAKYQDVAEWVESSQQLLPGTVVVLDSSKSNQVIASTQPYDSRIAGVISRQPGLMLGEEAEGRVLVATTGRVKVKVDANAGPIEIGDLLVTSDREGFASKSLPVDIGGVRLHRPGTLIGKALEPLKSGTGQILVLLSLQ